MFEIDVVTSPDALESCFTIRREVFVIEQNVPPELEIEENEGDYIHFLATRDGVPVGTARLMYKDDYAKIQRVAVMKEARGTGLGLALMQAVLDKIAADVTVTKTRLDAQLQAIPFYERLGFEAYGDVFDDAGIDHRAMLRTV